MEFVRQYARQAFALLAFTALVLCGGINTVLGKALTGPEPGFALASQGAASQKAPAQVSDAEKAALAKIDAAADVSAKLAAAAEYVAKFPHSQSIDQTGRGIAAKILAEPDAAQRVTHCESFEKIFTSPASLTMITPLHMISLADAKKPGDAIQLATNWLATHPDDIEVLTRGSLMGADEEKHGDNAFVGQSRAWGEKAISILESDVKPASLNDNQWVEFKSTWPAILYQSMGHLATLANDRAVAKKRLQKSIEINAADPFTFYLLGVVLDDEYQDTAKAAMADRSNKELLQKAITMLEDVVNAYGHAVALSEDKPQLKEFHDQLLVDLTNYYKFLHNDSAEGIQDFISKFKKA